MNSKNTPLFDLQLVQKSKIDSFDFEEIKFGNTFTDHMLICDYINGEWQQPIITAYAPFTIDPSAKVFHYGQAIFEGMKAYKDTSGDVWLFRPDQNFNRFNQSAERLAMPLVTEDIFIGGLHQLLSIEKEWVQYGEGRSLYVRPFMIAFGNGIMAQPSTHYRFMIILSPAKAYYNQEIKVTVSDYYSRAANGGIGFAKAAGNYAGQFYPTKLAIENGFQQIIWTDDATHTKLEEAGTMNVFFRIGDTLITAPTSERILDGITRKSIIELAQNEGIDVQVRDVLIDEIVAAAKNGNLKEIFGTGTAVVISPISGFSYQDTFYETSKTENEYSSLLKNKLTSIQRKEIEDPFQWTVKVQS